MSAEYNALNMESIKSKTSKLLTTKEALKEIKPINWDASIVSGKRKVTLEQKKRG